MEGNESLEKSKTISQLSLPEHRRENGARDSQNSNNARKQDQTQSTDNQTIELFKKASDETGSVKSKNSDSEDNEKFSDKDAANSKGSQKESEKFPETDNSFEKMQIEKSPTISVLSDPIEAFDNDDESSESEKENKTPLIPSEPSPSIHEIETEKFRSDLREMKDDGKFKVSNKVLSIEEKKERYKELIYTFVNQEEQPCLICLDSEAFINDDLFQCDLCNSVFHQSCFGSELIDIEAEEEQAEWYCHRCSYLLAFDLPFSAVRCEFCPELKGGIKRIKQKSDHKWGHVNCVNWIPEIYYDDGIEKQNVHGIDQYWKKKSAGRKALTCDFCKIKYGDCITCDGGAGEKCHFAFHVICGQIYGLIACWKDMQGLKRENDEEYYLPIYCKNHMKAYRKDMYEFSNKIERKNQDQLSYISYFYYTDSSSTPLKQRGSKKRQTDNKLSESAKTTRRLRKNADSPLPMEIEPPKSLTTPSKTIRMEPESIQESEKQENKRSLRPRKSVLQEEEDKIIAPPKSLPSSDTKEENKRSLRSKNASSKEASATKPLPPSQTPEKKQTTLKKDQSPISTPSTTGRLRSSNKEIPIEPEEIQQMFSIKARKRGVFAESIATRPAKKSVSKDDINKLDQEVSKKPEPIDNNDSDSSEFMEDKECQEEEKMQKLYKMKPNLESIIKFYEWGTEKEIKQEIQRYIRFKGLYNKAKKEVEVHKDPELVKVLGISTIPRQDVFKKFTPFMYEKQPELMAIRDDEDLPFCALYDQEVKKMKEAKLLESLKAKETKEAVKKVAPPVAGPVTRSGPSNFVKEQKPALNKQDEQSKKLKNVNNTAAVTTNQKVTRPTSSLPAKKDLPPTKGVTSQPLPAKKAIETKPQENENNNSLNSKREGTSLFDILHKGEDIYPSKKVKPNFTFRTTEVAHDTSSFLDSIFKSSSDNNKPENNSKDKNDGLEVFAALIKGDQLSLRRNMSWFTKSQNEESINEEDSINSAEVLKILWPKGAEFLF